MRISSVKAASYLLMGAALFVFNTCDKPLEYAGEVLATVGDRAITTEDFMRRAEYTIRPDYCADDNYIHRKIVLNSLIAEKLLALESPDSPLLENKEFQAYIQGRQEQAMRQWLSKTQGRDLVSVDSTELREALRRAIRTYDLQFLSLPDSAAVTGFQKAQADGYDFESIARALLDTDTIPSHEMTWFERGDEIIHTAVFAGEHEKGSLLEPMQLDDGQFVIIKIVGWTDRPLLAGQEYQQQVSDVVERVHQIKGDKRYHDYVAQLMAGKELELNPEVFRAYSRQAALIYLRTPKEKEQLLNQAIWNSEEQVITEALGGDATIPGEAVIFSVDGEDWTVERFERTLKRHPLVFRKRKMATSEFAEQLKYSIADLIRDEKLTQEAYKLDYDRVPNIRQQKEMWQDHYVSRQTRNDFVKQQMLAQADSLNRTETQVIDRYMVPYIDSLQTKRSDQITINTDLFEKLELSTVPMMVSSRNVAFPLSVPAFPRLTTDNLLNYGSRRD